MSSAIYLHQLIENWLHSSQHIKAGWICDEAMIWKPFHRYWFGINDANIECYQREGGEVLCLEAADPDFLTKLDKMLSDRA